MEVKFCCETKSKLLKHTQKLIELNYKIDLYQRKYLTNGINTYKIHIDRSLLIKSDLQKDHF